MSFIQVKNIEKYFGEFKILDNISMNVNKGDFIAIMGPSGSGKSTLLYSISGMDEITDGSVWIDGENLSEMKEEERARIRLKKMGFVFQNVQMLKTLTVLDNIMLPGLVAGEEQADVIRKRAIRLMQEMDISQIADRDIRKVSGGQLQRASICRAMINNPEVLFMDEPTGALNSEATEQVLEILKRLNKEGVTIVMVTHDPKVAEKTKKSCIFKMEKQSPEKMILCNVLREILNI